MKAARNWGDGHTTRERHLVADIRYGPASSAIRCVDGTVLQAATPEGLELLWQRHGGAILVPQAEDRVEPDQFVDEQRSITAMQAIMNITRACTCATTDITDCPNFIEGDLEDLSEEDI